MPTLDIHPCLHQMQVITTENIPADSLLWLKLTKILQVEACLLIDIIKTKQLIVQKLYIAPTTLTSQAMA